MKRLIYLFVSAIFILNMFAITAFAQEESNNANVRFINANGKITISGNVNQGRWKEVTAIVVNPSGGIDYIDQTTSGSEGAYVFRYTMINKPEEGKKYILLIGGSYTNRPIKLFLNLTAEGEIIIASESTGSIQTDIQSVLQ